MLVVKVLTETEGDKKGRRQGWTTGWLLWITGKGNIFFIGYSVCFEYRILCHLKNFIIFPNTMKNVYIGYLQLFIAQQCVEMCFI